MASGDKLARFLHKNTSKITVILVYAVLEWILIFLLLLNSLFTYMITKFAHYFGLKPPCPWCCRVDHLLEPGNSNSYSYRDLVCDKHATEISELSYCSSHRKLADAHVMCDQCLASRPTPSHSDDENKNNKNNNFIGMTKPIALISRASSTSTSSEHKVKNGEKVVPCCSCCKGKGSFGSKLHPSCFLSKPCWVTWDYVQKGNLIIEALEEADGDGCSTPDSQVNQDGEAEDMIEIELNTEEDHKENFEGEGARAEHQMDVESFAGEGEEEEGEGSRSVSVSVSEMQDICGGSMSMNTTDEKQLTTFTKHDRSCFTEYHHVPVPHFINQQYVSDHRVFPIELIDLSTTSLSYCKFSPIEDTSSAFHDAAIAAIDDETETAENMNHTEIESGAGDINIPSIPFPDSDKGKEDDDKTREGEQFLAMHADQTEASGSGTKEPHNFPAQAQQQEKEDLNLLVEEPKPETVFDLPQVQDSVRLHAKEVDNVGTDEKEKSILLLMEEDNNKITSNESSSVHNNEAEEKFPETPTSLEAEGIHYLHTKLHVIEKGESGGSEESLDGSVVSEMESGDPTQTIQRLKASLKAERNALTALYAELEEERSASAIAANHTMAMITRLQEEKATMQMEALQYQRMMEEQSEYDQEALQLLNDLMIKRDKEKQQLEKELQLYRNKVLDYEAKQNMTRSKDGSVVQLKSRNSSASSTNVYVEDDSDDLSSIDLNREAKDEEDSSFSGSGHQENNTPTDDAILNLEEMALDCVNHINALDDSLTEFEEERLSILDQLKALEEKLLTMGDDQFMQDLKSVHSSFNIELSTSSKEESKAGASSDGFSKDTSHSEAKTMASMAKSLLPLLGAADDDETSEKQGEESETVEMQHHHTGAIIDLDAKKFAFEQEVDRVYQRLQALEEDKEFLENCMGMGAINNGDKGMDLLQEILQHLRDLKAVELRTTNIYH